MSKVKNCPDCNGNMKEWGNGGNEHYKCEQCNSIYLLNYEGYLVRMYFAESTERKCEECGYSLKNGSYTAAWENGNNPDSYIKCKHCGHVTFL